MNGVVDFIVGAYKYKARVRQFTVPKAIFACADGGG